VGRCASSAPSGASRCDWPATTSRTSATLSSSEATVGPTLTLTEVEVVFEGEEAALDGLIERFAQKAMRAGG
jgi:hypothetical protein